MRAAARSRTRCPGESLAPAGSCNGSAANCSMVTAHRQQQDYRNWHTQHPQQNSATHKRSPNLFALRHFAWRQTRRIGRDIKSSNPTTLGRHDPTQSRVQQPCVGVVHTRPIARCHVFKVPFLEFRWTPYLRARVRSDGVHSHCPEALRRALRLALFCEVTPPSGPGGPAGRPVTVSLQARWRAAIRPRGITSAFRVGPFLPQTRRGAR